MASIVVGTLRALLTLDSAEFEAGSRRAQRAFGDLSKSAQAMGRQASQLGASLTKTLTLPILGFGGAMAKAAMDFESSFAGVRKTVNATEVELSAMAQSLRDLSKTIPVNVNELNRLAEAAGAMGIPKAEIVEFSRVMALLGVTTNVTSDQAAESIGKIQNIFASAGKETDRFAATLVALGNDGASTESQILEMATRIAGAGNVIGLTQGQVLGFASALSSVGLEAEAGGTAISRVFVDIASSVSMGGKALAQFANVAGMSTAAFSKMFREDAAGAVLAFIEGLGRIKASGGDVLGVLAAMGIEEVRLRDTLLRASGAGDILRQSLVLQAKAWKDNSALTEEARKRFETTSSQMTLLWNRVKDVAITLGNALLPMIKATVSVLDDLVPIIESVARTFAALPTPIQAVVVGLGLAVAAAGPLLFVFGQLAIAAGGLAAAFATRGVLAISLGSLTTSFGAAVVAIRAMTVASLAFMATPLGLTLAALAAAATIYWKATETSAKVVAKSTTEHMRLMSSHGAVATSVGSVTAALKAGEPALDKNLFQTKASTEASEKAAAAKLKEAEAFKALSEQRLEQAHITSLGLVQRQYDAVVESQERFIANLQQMATIDPEPWLESSAIAMPLHQAPMIRRTGAIAEQVEDRWSEMTDSLKRTWGTLETAIQGSFAQILLRTRSFKEAMVDIWNSIKGAIVNIFADIAAAYIKQIARMAAVKWGMNLGGGGGVLGSVLGGGASAAAGAGGAAAAGGAGVAGAAGGAAGAGGAGGTAAAGGIGVGAGVATAGIAAAAIALYWGIRHKGLFRGGAEALHVNPRRDKFQLQFGGPPVSVGGTRLSERLFALGSHPLFGALQAADTVRKFESAQAAIVGRLGRAGQRVQSFALGGFVPPGAVVPAILHGGAFGEVVQPVESGGASRAVTINVSFQGYIDESNLRRVWTEKLIPMANDALRQNTGGFRSTVMRAVTP